MLQLPATAAVLPVLSAYPRDMTGGLLDGLRGALTSRRVIEHESVRLDGAFRIAVDDRQERPQRAAPVHARRSWSGWRSSRAATCASSWSRTLVVAMPGALVRRRATRLAARGRVEIARGSPPSRTEGSQEAAP